MTGGGAANLSAGGTARDVTDAVHPTVARMCERAARIVGPDVCGLDLITPDIAAPLPPRGAGVIEVNAAPGRRMHHHLRAGQPRDAGGAIVDMLYPGGDSRGNPAPPAGAAVTARERVTESGLAPRKFIRRVLRPLGPCATYEIRWSRGALRSRTGPPSGRSRPMTPNDVGTCEWLAAEIAHSHLAGRDEIDPIIAELRAEQPYADATALADHLVRRGLLTAFQATRLLEGQGRGLVLGPYILADTVGSGSLGTVYKAIGRGDRRAYALKVLPLRSPWNVRQARKRLHGFPPEPHPAVVPLIDVGTSAGLHYLVWPFAEGETLEQLVRREGLLPPARAALIALQVVQALQWCERHRIYHGALKPSNLMLGPDGQTRLLDFGIGAMLAEAEDASLVDTLSEANVTGGLIDSTAPECLVDPSRRSVRGDQYSLGCVLYYGLTGRYPFPDGNMFEKLEAHQSKAPIPVTALNPGVPPVLASILDRLLQKAPEARYVNIDELVSALMPLARQSSVYTPPDSPTPPPFRAPAVPTATPMPATPSLLAAVQPRQSPSSRVLPPPAPTPVPRPSRRSSMNLPPSDGSGSAVIPPMAPQPAADPLRGPPAPPSGPESGTFYPPVPLHPTSASSHALAGPLQPPPPPPPLSLGQRLVRALTFWIPRSDPVACSLLTPAGALPGETVVLQVVVHHADRAGQARTLPDWRGTQAIPTPVERGEPIGLHLSLQHLDVRKPLGRVQWSGLSVATTFSVEIPKDWSPDWPLQGTLTIGLRHQPVARLEFALPVAVGQAQ